MKKERTHTDNINSCIDRVRLIRRMNALISSLPRLAQDGPIEMAAQPETLTVGQTEDNFDCNRMCVGTRYKEFSMVIYEKNEVELPGINNSQDQPRFGHH